MCFEKVVYEKNGPSFAVAAGQRRPIIVWSVARLGSGALLIHFSLRPPDGLVNYYALAKFTARVAEGETEVLCGSFYLEEQFRKEAARKKALPPDV